MRRSVGMLILALAALAGAACGGGGGTGGGTVGPLVLAVGDAEAEVLLDRDGHLPTALFLNTGASACFAVEAGTRLATPRGTALTGRLRLRIEDVARATGATATLRVRAELLRSDDSVVPVAACFDPPARVCLTDVLPTLIEGAWRWERRIAEDGSDEPATQLDAAAFVDVRSREIPVARTGLVSLFLQSPPTAAPAAHVFDAPGVVELVLGDIGLDLPSVGCVQLADAASGEIVASHCWVPGLARIGERRLLAGGDFEVQIVEVARRRVLRIGTRLGNPLDVLVQRWGGATPDTVLHVELALPGVSDETDEALAYVGDVDVTARGAGGFPGASAAAATLTGALPEGARLLDDGFEPLGGGRLVAHWRIAGLRASVRTLGPALPAGWDVSYADRALEIALPYPEPLVVTASESDQVLHVLDPDLLVVVTTSDPLPAAPGDFALLSDRRALVARAGGLEVVDLDSGALLPALEYADVEGGLAVDPWEEAVLLTTTTGRLVAFDLAGGGVRFAIDALTPGAASPTVAIRADGAFCYLVDAPGDVVEVDLLRRETARTFFLPGTSRLALSQDGERLAAVVPGDGGVEIVDLAHTAVPTSVATGSAPVALAWVTDDACLLVVDEVDQTLAQIDPVAFTVVSGPAGARPLDVAVHATGASSPPRVLVVDRDGPGVLEAPFVDAATPLLLVPLATAPAPTAIRALLP